MSTVRSMDRATSLLVVFILVITPLAAIMPSALAGNVDSFSDGDTSKDFALDGSPDTSSSITVPGQATILNAKATISSVAGEPVMDPQLDVGDDGTVEWAFTGTGYGPLGHQTVFADDEPTLRGALPKGGTAVGLELMLPRDATITSAKIDLQVQSKDTYVQWDFGGLFNIHTQYSAAPTFGDLDGDGDQDVVVGSNWGYLSYHENDGTAAVPNWTSGIRMQNQAGNDIDTGYSSVPVLVDIDNDNDLDLILGAGDGTIYFYENTGNATNPKWMNNNGLLGSADIGYYAAPTFADIDNDNDYDLICGEYYGRVAYTINTGSAASPTFDHDAANWVWMVDDVGLIDVGLYSQPAWTDIDGDSDLDVVIGNYGGTVFFKNNTNTVWWPLLRDDGYILDKGDPIYVDYMSKPVFVDLDNDGDMDMPIGTGYGNVDYYENVGAANGYIYIRPGLLGNYDVGAEAVPSLGDFDGDGDQDLVVGNQDGDLVFYKNIGTSTDPVFSYDHTVPNVTPWMASPQLVDYDFDGDLDIVVGNSTGVLTYLKNIGDANNLVLLADSTVFGSLDFGTDVRPYMADLDNDGDLDLTIGDGGWDLDYYENTGSVATPDWDWDGDMYYGLPTGGYRTTPVLYDFDGDSDLDLMIGHAYGTMTYFENSGDQFGPVWSITGAPFERIDMFIRSSPTFGDLDCDGFPDMIGGNSYGKLHKYTKDVLSKQYDAEIGFYGEPQPIWSTTSQAPVLDTTVDITDALKDQVPVSAYDPDTFGNIMSTVELTVTVDPVGCNYALHNLNITYDYSVETKDFSDNINTYVSYHSSDIGPDGNITIPITISSSSAGGLNLSGIDIEYDGPPVLVEPIPDLEIEEETSNATLLDLHAYFDDEETSDAMMKYMIESNDLNSSMVSVTIFNNKFLSVDAMNPEASANWTGSGTIVVSAEDTLGNKRLSNGFKVTVTDVNDLPWFTSEPVTTITADNLYEYDVNASDVDVEDQLVYSFEISPDGMNINSITGQVSWMPTNAQVAIHGVRVAVSDGEDTVVQTFSITVLGNPATNHVPVFTTFPVTTGFVGSDYEYDADAIDSDPGTKLQFELVKGPDQMSLNKDTGLLVWGNLINPYIGKHDIKLKVTDGVASALQNFTLIIAPNPKDNKPPRFLSPPKDFAYPGDTYMYEPRVDDPNTMDMGNLVIWLEVGPDDMTIENGKTLTWNPTDTHLGDHLVVLGVRDLAGEEALQSFTLHVIKVAGTNAVIILSPSDGEKVSGTFKVVGTLNTSVQNAIELVQIRFDGKEWKDASGTKTWSYSADMTPGQHDIEVRAYDGKNYSASSKIKVQVKDEQLISVGESGAEGLVILLLVLLIIFVLISYIIGTKKGRRMAEETTRPEKRPLSRDAEKVKAKEESFYKDVYEGKDMQPSPDESEEGSFRGEAPPEEEYGYEETPATEEAYQPEPEPEPEHQPEPEPGPELESEPVTEEPAFEDVPVEEEPSPGPPKPKKVKDEKSEVLDDILAKLQD